MAARLLVIPCPIVEGHTTSIPVDTITALHHTRHFVVERLRTARRYISSTKPPYRIDDLSFVEMDKHAEVQDTSTLIQWLKDGHDVGILSESGCPGIADPGSEYVRAAHMAGYEVVPLVGPSSIVLALMASGMSGQSFAFNGYLPIKSKALTQKLRDLDRLASAGQTQLWIETPYRNDKHIKVLLDNLGTHLKLCIATEITAPDSNVKTKTVEEWRKRIPTIGKRNTLYVLGM